MKHVNTQDSDNPRGVVLLIESDPNLARGMELDLSRQGLDVLLSGSHLKALSILEDREDVDIVLVMAEPTDIGGFDFIHLLRHRNRFAGHCPQVIVIASSESFERFPSDDSGFDDYLLRPYFSGELAWRVNKALRTVRFKKREAASHLLDQTTTIHTITGLKLALHEELNKISRKKGVLSLMLFLFKGLETIALNHGNMMVQWLERDIAMTLRISLRSYDRLGRLETGGYCLIAPDVGSANAHLLADRLAERVRQWNADAARHSPIQIPISMAVHTVTVFPDFLPHHLEAAAQTLWAWINHQGMEALAEPGRLTDVRLTEQGVKTVLGDDSDQVRADNMNPSRLQ